MKTLAAVSVYVFAGGIAFLLGQGWSLKSAVAKAGAYYQRATFEARYLPATDPFESGEEVVMVYIGRLGCAPSNALGLPDLVEEMKVDLDSLTRSGGASFRAIGIALDSRADDGWKHLSRFGRFDEKYVGGGLFSDMAMRYLWQDFPGLVATPQVVVVRRIRVSQGDRTSPEEYRLEDQEEVGRLIGLDGIGGWRRSSASAQVILMRLALGESAG